MKASYTHLLTSGRFDWLVLVPEAKSHQRTMAAESLVEALHEKKYSGDVIVLSHEDVNPFAVQDGREKMAELHRIEKIIFDDVYLHGVYFLRRASKYHGMGEQKSG